MEHLPAALALRGCGCRQRAQKAKHIGMYLSTGTSALPGTVLVGGVPAGPVARDLSQDARGEGGDDLQGLPRTGDGRTWVPLQIVQSLISWIYF